MSSIDEQFVEYIVKSLVGNPDAVSIQRTIDEKGVLLELTVDPEDLGRVIGKRGGTAQSIRTLLRALGTKNDARYNLKIIDNGEGRPAPRPRDDQQPADEHADSVEPKESDEEPPKSEDDDSWTSKPPVADDDEEKEEDHSSTLSKTRKELADLDDLDV